MNCKKQIIDLLASNLNVNKFNSETKVQGNQ